MVESSVSHSSEQSKPSFTQKKKKTHQQPPLKQQYDLIQYIFFLSLDFCLSFFAGLYEFQWQWCLCHPVPPDLCVQSHHLPAGAQPQRQVHLRGFLRQEVPTWVLCSLPCCLPSPVLHGKLHLHFGSLKNSETIRDECRAQDLLSPHMCLQQACNNSGDN